MKSFLGWISHKAPILITYGVLLSFVAFLFIYKQNSLIPGANSHELQVAEQVQNFEYPWRSSVDAPYITSAWLVSEAVFSDPLVSARLVASIASILSVLMFYQLLRNWLLSPGKALVGAALFAVSSWTLVLGRGAHGVVVGVFLLLLIFTLGTRLLFTTKPLFDWTLLMVALGLSLYTPLVPWLVFIIGMVSLFHYKQRQRSVPLKLWQKFFVAGAFFLTVLPLLLSFIHEPGQALELLGVNDLKTSIPDVFLNVVEAIRTIFFIGSLTNPIGLGNTPMLDIFSVFMFLLGCYYFERRLALKRSKMLFGSLAIGLIVCSFGDFDFIRYGLLLPIIYIFIAAGLHETISRWLAVFPKNPIARGVGVVILAVALGFVSQYHLRKVFVARPANPEIRSLYSVE